MDIFDGVEVSDEMKEALQKNLESQLQSNFVAKDEFESVVSNRDEILAEKREEADKRRLLDEEAKQKSLEASKAKGDIESLSASYEEKISSLESQLHSLSNEKKVNTLSEVAKSFVDSNVVDDAFVRSSMTQEIMKRLDLREGNTVVLNADGGLSSHTVDDLFNEIKSSAMFKPHIVVSKASGGGASGNGTAGGNSLSDLATKSLADAKTPEERKQILSARLNAAS